MRATEIIRGVLDLIDQLECEQQQELEQAPEPIATSFKEIFATMYDNSPNPHVKDIASVTTAAGLGGIGVKSPADIRSDSVSMYPNFQAKK